MITWNYRVFREANGYYIIREETKRSQTPSTVAYSDVEIPKRYPHGEPRLLAVHSQFPASSSPHQPLARTAFY